MHLYIFRILIDLLKKYSVSDMGALILLNDINAYIGLISGFGTESQQELSTYFAFLREIANLLMVKPENLRSVLQEGTLNLIDIRLAYPFISLRADYKSSNIEALFPDISASKSISGMGLF
mgnify:CR=1 FL=1